VSSPANFPRVRNRRRTRLIVVASIAGVVLTAVFVGYVVQVASSRPTEVNLGDERFVVGRADRFAERIAADGPILFKDPLTSKPGREVYVQHLGSADDEGWSAIDAYPPDNRSLACLLVWEQAAKRFRDPCGSATFPADGSGLRIYPGNVDDRGAVVIDLRTQPEP
jgi:hypothetical protein